MTRPAANVLTLLELLQSGGTRTAAELADRLGVDERTARRYIDHLVELDVPVQSVRGRYGGYRLAAGYRLPPLMLSDDEALAVLLSLVAGQRAGLTSAAGAASETAAAKIRRVLPDRVARCLQALLETLALTSVPVEHPVAVEHPAPETAVLLSVADAVRHHRPVSIRYADVRSRRTERILHAYGLVAHRGRWYVTGVDAGTGHDRTFRLDRITEARVQPGTFEPPADVDPAQRVLSGFATAPYRHHVIVWIHGTEGQIRTRLPASVATITPAGPAGDGAPETGAWQRAEIRAERLDWLPPVLASLDLEFAIEGPAELRDLITALAGRLTASAARLPPGTPGE
jgi:predicted DNA-binding transcriptional regulator YafY